MECDDNNTTKKKTVKCRFTDKRSIYKVLRAREGDFSTLH